MTAPIIHGYVEYDGFTWMFSRWPTIEPDHTYLELGVEVAQSTAPWGSASPTRTFRIDEEGQASLHKVGTAVVDIPQTVTTDWVISKDLIKVGNFHSWSPSPMDFAETRTLVLEGGRVVKVIDGVRAPIYTLKERLAHGLILAVFAGILGAILTVIGGVASICMRMVSWLVGAL